MMPNNPLRGKLFPRSLLAVFEPTVVSFTVLGADIQGYESAKFVA